VLIFDEVKTGFRLGLGGAVAEYGVTPDIGTYAKAMGNGFPVAAIALNQRMVEGWELGGISQTGTYSGNGISVAAASATIDRLADGVRLRTDPAYRNRLMDGIQKSLDAHGLAGPWSDTRRCSRCSSARARPSSTATYGHTTAGCTTPRSCA
jgi:glutamate-1-semialdehyde 2,1-aminomutase